MNQRTTLEIIAPTVEEAIAQGLAQLGLTADAVSVEVLDAGTKGFFGLGKTQVRVRLTVNPPPGTVSTLEAQPEARPGKTTSRPAPADEIVEPEVKAPRHEAERLRKKPELAPAKLKEPMPQPEHDALLD